VLDRRTAKVLTEQHEVNDINDLTQLDEGILKQLLGKDLIRVVEACNRYPSVELTYELGGRDGDDFAITARLTREDELERESVISSHFPGEKEEFWWVIVGDKKNNRVLTTKRTLLKTKAELALEFEAPDCSKVTLYALCDSYIGCDQVEEVTLSQ
jgi:hypothetical protein